MVYLISAGVVFALLTVRACRKAQPAPRWMEEAEANRERVERALATGRRCRCVSERLQARARAAQWN